MIPEEAIKILTNRDCPEEDRLFKGYALAVKLGIEALEREKARREAELAIYPLNGFRTDWLLPSETEE